MSRPDASALRSFLARASRRFFWRSVAEGAAFGLGVALILELVGWPARGMVGGSLLIGAILAGSGVVLRLVTTTIPRHTIAHQVEQRAPHCRNLLVTAAELIEREQSPTPTQASGYVDGLVLDQASRLVDTLQVAALFPLRNALIALVTAAALWTYTVVHANAPAARHAAAVASAARSAIVDGIDVAVSPPAYAAQRTQAFHDPSRIEALVGSRLAITVRARAATVSIETLHGRQLLASDGAGRFTGEIAADADGYIAIEPARTDGVTGSRRLIGLTVIDDQPPHVRVTAPGRDLHFPDGRRTVDLAIEADDDIGMVSLKLRYTKVSGSGERFTFVDGDLPLTVSHTDARHWSARAAWRLAAVGLEPGDMVVYRAVARDGQPGAAAVESDSWIVEITAPGGIAAAGFAIDPEQERYAISQQMVILKTERLLARKATIPAEEFADSAAQLAAEQRKVRAEFVFMMGGEVGDDQGSDVSMTDLNEQTEADGESDLAAGRMVNAGRMALLRGIRYMSRAADGLTKIDVGVALGDEKKALVEVEKAFSHSRIILRALTQRERLDLSRRLTGTLTEAVRDVRPSAEPAPTVRVVALRRALADVATLAAPAALPVDAAARATRLAERVLRIDPSARQLQEIATLLADAATNIGRGQDAAARALLDRAATGIATSLHGNLQPSPADRPGPELQRLRGALADRLRHPQVPR